MSQAESNRPANHAEHRPGPHHGLVDSALEQLVKDSRSAGVKRFQVLAVVHHSGDNEHVLLLNRPADLWSLPLAWVHSGESIPDTLDWLCNIDLRLPGWNASFSIASVWEIPDDGEALQIAFEVTIPATGEPSWNGTYQWWHIHKEPPPLHRASRPVLEQRFHIPPDRA